MSFFPTFSFLSFGILLHHFSFCFADEVERLLRDYKQNQDFIRNLGNRFYQIIYPIQVRQREKFGVSTREIEGSYGKVNFFNITFSLLSCRAESKKKMTFDKKIRISFLLEKQWKTCANSVWKIPELSHFSELSSHFFPPKCLIKTTFLNSIPSQFSQSQYLEKEGKSIFQFQANWVLAAFFFAFSRASLFYLCLPRYLLLFAFAIGSLLSKANSQNTKSSLFFRTHLLLFKRFSNSAKRMRKYWFPVPSIFPFSFPKLVPHLVG